MNELTFLDLVILKKIDANSSVENFGSQINTSFFETANLLGTVKIKGYVNIETSIGGISKVTITDAGMGILTLAEKKAADPIEPLDNALLHALAGGAKDPETLQSSLNIRSGDLAYHINKMTVQSFMDYEVRSSKVNLMLTEQGFNSTGGVKVQRVPSTQIAAQPDAKKNEKTAAEGGASRIGDSAAQQNASSVRAHMPPADLHGKSAPIGAGGSNLEANRVEKKEKEDILHILRGGDKEEKKQEHQPHTQHEQPKEDASHSHEHHKGHEHTHEKTHDELPLPESPEEKKKHEHTRRMFSKIQYYLAEYWAWILLIIIATVIFAGAVYTMLSRVA